MAQSPSSAAHDYIVCKTITVTGSITFASASTTALTLSGAFQTATATVTGVSTFTGKATFNGSIDVGSAGVLAGVGTGANGIKLKNLKNAAATALSGTQKDIEIDIGGTPYYFTCYPTKA
jgi:hypothetical protein